MNALDLTPIGRPSESVREIETQDGTLLLDIRQGLCFVLSVVGSIIWRRLQLHETIEEIVSYLSRQFTGIPRQVIQSDTTNFIREIQRKGILIQDDARSTTINAPHPRLLSLLQSHQKDHFSRNRRTRLLFWKALVGLAVYDCFGFGRDFFTVHSSISTWPVADKIPVGDVTEEVCHAVDRACLWYPKRVLCLQRSAVKICLLRNCGVPARMTIGAQRFPFKAHAWTEINGRPLHERREVEKIYLVWNRC